MEQGYCTEWQCWVCARACQAGAGHGAGHGGCGCCGWVVRQAQGHQARAALAFRSQAAADPCPSHGSWAGGVLLLLIQGNGWAHPCGQGSRMLFVLGHRDIQPLVLGTPLVWELSREKQNSGYRKLSCSFFQTQTRMNCPSFLSGF